MSRVVKLMCLAVFVLALLQIGDAVEKDGKDNTKLQSNASLKDWNKLKQLLRNNNHNKKKTKELGELLKTKFVDFQNQVKDENQKLSKNDPKSTNRLASKMRENALLAKATAKVGYKWIKEPVKKLVEEVGQVYSDEKKKLPQDKSKSKLQRGLSKTKTFGNATKQVAVKRGNSLKRQVTNFYNDGKE